MTTRRNRFFRTRVCAAAMTALLGTTAFAQGPTPAPNNTADVQRDVNQQNRIESGLQSGQLNTREASELESQQSHIDHMEQRADRNGSISPAEQARINAAQNHASRNIDEAKHNGVRGNPYSTSSQRMQADVQRNANQQQRIENGVRSGSLTNRETGALERGQAHTARRDANAGANGHVGAREQARVQRADNRQSRHVYDAKHNARARG